MNKYLQIIEEKDVFSFETVEDKFPQRFKKGHTPCNKGKKTGVKPWLGKKRSVETKRKIRRKMKGRLPQNTGKIRTEKTKEKIRNTKKGQKCLGSTKKKISETMRRLEIHPPIFKGEKSSAWIDGRSFNREHQIFLAKRRNAKRKALKKEAVGSHTLEEWKKLKAKYHFTCPSCHRHEPNIKLTEDNITPLSKDGTDYIENIQPLCRSCNSKKYDKKITFLNL